ncbi:hypothetical protein [Psychroserpens sp.]|uniref:hypothetical protein n=1 Tax=Psychroserpens sp. TaxID=2020870 RepID=UPI003C72D2AF
MKFLKPFFFLISFSSICSAQVGIGNTDPKAQLDISASNTTTPANTDGILIPRVSDLVISSNMTANQDGMLVFYTGNAYDGKGFYFWDQSTSNWNIISSSNKNTLDQAYNEGGNGNGKNITADAGAVKIDGTDGFFVTGAEGSGVSMDSELSGSGPRMFFQPSKSAFRAGYTSSNQWVDSQIGNRSTAFGFNSTASATYSVAFGFSTSSTGFISTAFGRSTIASNQNSTAFGRESQAEGFQSTAFGYNTVASGANSTAFGLQTVANSEEATAFGFNTIASGDRSTAFGDGTLASGINSTAFGINTTASGSYSTAFGFGTNAPGTNETAIGRYNTIYDPAVTAIDKIFVIGKGSSNSFRSNALNVYANGEMNINDEYSMPLTDGTPNQVLKTDGSGNLSFEDLPGNDLVLCKVRTNVTQGIGYEKIDFTQEMFDTNNNFNITTDGFQAPDAGYYRINANLKIVGSGTRTFGIAIYIQNVLNQEKIQTGHNGVDFNIDIDTVLYLTQGQTVSLYSYGTGSAFINEVDLDNDPSNNYLEIVQIK